MPRERGTANTPQSIIDKIVSKHAAGYSLRELAAEYGKPFKTIKNMIRRENNKKRHQEVVQITKKNTRKSAETLQEYRYENKCLRMENELL